MPNAKKFQYGDKLLTPDGVPQVKLQTGVGNASLKFKGKGVLLEPPDLVPGPGLRLPVTVVLKNTENGECWQATYTALPAERITINNGEAFKAVNSN